MSSRNEPAFPTQMWDVEDEKVTWLDGGLTKREFIATVALQGLLASGSGGDKSLKILAAVDYADLLLEEIKRRTE